MSVGLLYPTEVSISQFTVLFAFSAGILLVVAAYIYPRRTTAPGANWLLLLILADASWALISIGSLEAPTYQLVTMFEVARITISGLTPVLWVLFALVYTGRDDWVTPWTIAGFLAIPALNLFLYVTNSFHQLWYQSAAIEINPVVNVITYEFGFASLVVIGIIYFFIIFGTWLIVETALTAPNLYTDQTIALVIGALVPLLISLIVITGMVSQAGIDITPAGLSVTGLTFAYALFRRDLLESTPAVATLGEQQAVEALSEAFLIVDQQNRIVRANSAAERILNDSCLIGSNLDDALPDTVSIPKTGRFEFATVENQRVFEGTVAQIQSDTEPTIGRVLSIRDITEREHRKERLQVLDRLLRHNLRNDLNVVGGQAELLATDLEGVEPDAVTRARSIQETAMRLVEKGEKIRRFEQVIDVEQSTTKRTVEIDEIINSAVNTVAADFPDAQIEPQLEDVKSIETSPEILSLVLEEVLDNAVRHNAAEIPKAEINISEAADAESAITIRVIDNGVGIPDTELEPIEQGKETQLQHASGIGLWLVQWGIEQLDGKLNVNKRDSSGTTVEILLPIHDIKSD